MVSVHDDASRQLHQFAHTARTKTQQNPIVGRFKCKGTADPIH